MTTRAPANKPWWQNQEPAIRALKLEDFMDLQSSSWDKAILDYPAWYILTYAAAPTEIQNRIEDEFDTYCWEKGFKELEDLEELDNIKRRWFIEAFYIFWNERCAMNYTLNPEE